jgi:hypothetical protein
MPPALRSRPRPFRPDHERQIIVFEQLARMMEVDRGSRAEKQTEARQVAGSRLGVEGAVANGIDVEIDDGAAEKLSPGIQSLPFRKIRGREPRRRRRTERS